MRRRFILVVITLLHLEGCTGNETGAAVPNSQAGGDCTKTTSSFACSCPSAVTCTTEPPCDWKTTYETTPLGAWCRTPPPDAGPSFIASDYGAFDHSDDFVYNILKLWSVDMHSQQWYFYRGNPLVAVIHFDFDVGVRATCVQGPSTFTVPVPAGAVPGRFSSCSMVDSGSMVDASGSVVDASDSMVDASDQ